MLQKARNAKDKGRNEESVNKNWNQDCDDGGFVSYTDDTSDDCISVGDQVPYSKDNPSVCGQVLGLNVKHEKERTGADKKSANGQAPHSEDYVLVSGQAKGSSFKSDRSREQLKVKRTTYSVSTKLIVIEKYYEWRNNNLEMNQHLPHTFMQQFDFTSVGLTSAIKDTTFRDWLVNGRLLSKVRENKSKDPGVRVRAEVTSLRERDYKEVEDALKDKYLSEGGAMYITKHKISLDALEIASQVYSTDIEKCHKFKASPDWVKNFLFYKAPNILMKCREKHATSINPTVSPNTETMAIL